MSPSSRARYRLELWLYGVHTAEVIEERSGKLSLTYTEDAIERWGAGSPVLSVSMPMRHERYTHSRVGPWVEGLLPEGPARDAAERVVGVRRGDTFAFLAEVGRDSAGAVIFLRPGEVPSAAPSSLVPLDPSELEEAIANLETHPLGLDGQVRVSLAGLQDKLLLVSLDDGRWARPIGGIASTHILKPENALFPGLVVNEAVCLRAANLLGLTTVDVQTVTVGGRPVLIVSRYDRRPRPTKPPAAPVVERIHQEDVCQALSVDTTVSNRKYEKAGGPSLVDVAQIVDRWADDGERALRQLLRLVVFNVVIGNADAHGKNISLLHMDDGSVRLAPSYDLVSTTQWKTVMTRGGEREVSRQMAMSVGGEFDVDSVTLESLVDESERWPLGDGHDIASELLGRYTDAIIEAGVDFDAPKDLVERLVARGESLRRGEPVGSG